MTNDPNTLARGSTRTVGQHSAAGYAYLLAMLTAPLTIKGKPHVTNKWRLQNATECFRTADTASIMR